MTMQEIVYIKTRPMSHLDLWEDQQYYDAMFRGTGEAN